MTIKTMVEKFEISLVRAGERKGQIQVAKGNKATQEELQEMRNSKKEIIQYLEKRNQERQERRKAREIEKKQKIELQRLEIENGNKKIQVQYHEGEYLSGYMVFGLEAEMLEELELAHYVDGWGYLVHKELEELGSEFTLEEAKEAGKTKEKQEQERTEELEEERKLEAKQEEARMLGEKVEIYRFADDCDGSLSECSADIIIGYIDGAGRKTSERIHTH